MNSHYKGFDVAGAAYNDTQCRSEWFAKRVRSAREQTISGGVLSCVYVRYHIITSLSCRSTRC